MPPFVALISCSSTEPVYFVKIEKKGISKRSLRDCYVYTVLDGDVFMGKYQRKVRLKKTNKNQFKILEKDKYVTPGEIFKSFKGIANDLRMNDDETFKNVHRHINLT